MAKITVEIVQDDDPIDPREDAKGNCLGTMVCWHRNYKLGEKHGYENPTAFEEEWKGKALILPVFLYDHSGITINTTGFSCPWDSGQVGYIYASHAKIAEEYGKVDETTLEKARKVLVSEVEIYDQYLRGDVYGYVVTKITRCKECARDEKEVVDSCFGYFGYDHKKNGLLDSIPKKYRKYLKEA